MGRWPPGLQRLKGTPRFPWGVAAEVVWTSSETGCSQVWRGARTGSLPRVWNVIRGRGGREGWGGGRGWGEKEAEVKIQGERKRDQGRGVERWEEMEGASEGVRWMSGQKMKGEKSERTGRATVERDERKRDIK